MFTQALVGSAEDDRLRNSWMGGEDVFDDVWEDGESATGDGVVKAPVYVEAWWGVGGVPVAVVIGAEPAGALPGNVVGFVEVAGGNGVSAQPDAPSSILDFDTCAG